MAVLHVLLFLAGASIALITLSSALRTFVLPRGTPTRITSLTFITVRMLFNFRLQFTDDYFVKDRVLAIYGPTSVVALAAVWVASVGFGFTLMFWGLGAPSFTDAVVTSGSSLLTLGYHRPDRLRGVLLSFVEAGVGLGLVAVVIAYLPTINAAFNRREVPVSLLETLAGTPFSPLVLLRRFHRIRGLGELEELWVDWRAWFADIDETHTSIAAVVFFRSPRPLRSWITAAGCILDAAALRSSCIDLPRSPNAELCIRMGFLTLRHIADFFGVPYNPEPGQGDATSVSRADFDAVWAELEGVGVPLKSDQEQAFLDYNGWRVNYDAVLLALCALTSAPPSLWAGDRAPAFRMPPLRRQPWLPGRKMPTVR